MHYLKLRTKESLTRPPTPPNEEAQDEGAVNFHFDQFSLSIESKREHPIRPASRDNIVSSRVTRCELVNSEGVITQDGILYLVMRIKSFEKFGDHNIEINKNTAEGVLKMMRSIPEEKRALLFSGEYEEPYRRFIAFLDSVVRGSNPVHLFSGNSAKLIFRAISRLQVEASALTVVVD